MQRLSEIANALTREQEGHHDRLEEAQQQALQVLNTLDSVQATAVTFKSTLIGGFGLTKWWPYVFCPIMTLVVGSYGLPPSAVRNVVLVSVGEWPWLNYSGRDTDDCGQEKLSAFWFLPQNSTASICSKSRRLLQTRASRS